MCAECDDLSIAVRAAESLCEPRPRVVPEVGSGLNVDSRGVYGPYSVISGAVHLPNGDVVTFGPLQPSYSVKSRGHGWVTVTAPLDWSRGFDYDSLGEGHYADD